MAASTTPSTSTPPSPPAVLLYDGRCRLCVASRDRILRLARPGAVVARDLHEPGALDAAHGRLTREQAMASIHLVEADGRLRRGLDAVARAIATRGGIARLVNVYYAPIVRQAADAAYRLVARHRYRIGGAAAAASCGERSCCRRTAPQAPDDRP
jgi:predicted DCC family thiol-disulfide oxidoreductase YuxK